jgi:hypothetical protein
MRVSSDTAINVLYQRLRDHITNGSRENVPRSFTTSTSFGELADLGE